MSTAHGPRFRWLEYRFASACALGVALIVAGASWSGRVGGVVLAQELNPCALLSDDDVKSLAVADIAGVTSALPSFGYTSCRYAWGDGIDRVRLVVVVTDPARKFPGLTQEQIKQRLLGSVRDGTHDAVIADVGEAAVFKPESFVYAIGTAFVKGRLLEVQLDGLGAVDMKDRVIALLKSAASRLS